MFFRASVPARDAYSSEPQYLRGVCHTPQAIGAYILHGWLGDTTNMIAKPRLGRQVLPPWVSVFLGERLPMLLISPVSFRCCVRVGFCCLCCRRSRTGTHTPHELHRHAAMPYEHSRAPTHTTQQICPPTSFALLNRSVPTSFALLNRSVPPLSLARVTSASPGHAPLHDCARCSGNRGLLRAAFRFRPIRILLRQPASL